MAPMLLSLLLCLVEAWVTKDWPPTQPIRIGRILRQTPYHRLLGKNPREKEISRCD